MKTQKMAIEKMWEWLNETLCTFRNCFKREAAFRWFVVIIIGFMIRTDYLGITSLIRELGIAPRHYETILHFFRAKSWNLEDVRKQWLRIVKSSKILFFEDCLPILIGDGVKQGKEAKKMPCVKRLFQESENSSKASYIHGHMFGAIGILIGNAQKMFCVPISMTIHDGTKQIDKWLKSNTNEESHVVKTIRQAFRAASILSPFILLLDRYFLTVPALKTWILEEKQAGHSVLSIITKAKSNAVAYEKPVAKTGRGRPPLKGKTVKLKGLFTSCQTQFTQTTVKMYGKTESVSYLCKDLLWGKQLYHELRFILVRYGPFQTILVCTNTDFSPEKIIRLYSYRFKIESCFRELKQVIHGFAYHFWSKAMPKLDRYAKSGSEPLDVVTNEKDKDLIISAFNAIERFVMSSCIAMGLLQICSVKFSDIINQSALRWLRTCSNKIPSEATTSDFIRKSIFRIFPSKQNLTIIRLIHRLLPESSELRDSNIA